MSHTILFIGGIHNGKTATIQWPPQLLYHVPHPKLKPWQLPSKWRPGLQQADQYYVGTDILGNLAYRFVRTVNV